MDGVVEQRIAALEQRLTEAATVAPPANTPVAEPTPKPSTTMPGSAGRIGYSTGRLREWPEKMSPA